MKIRRGIALLAAFSLLSASAALADMQKGDRGNDVAELQQMLYETGNLLESPDGIYGSQTEAAVKEFERYASLPVDGIADDLMQYELSVAYQVILDGKNSGTDYAEYCITWTDVNGDLQKDYCQAHHVLNEDARNMLDSNDPEVARAASDMWQAEVSSLYDRWEELLPDEERSTASADAAGFLASIEAQRTMSGLMKKSADAKIATEVGISESLRSEAVRLCGEIYQLENGRAVAGITAEEKAVRLNGSVIIEGNTIYYSGSLDGDGYGIYTMNADGSNIRKISDMMATLEACSNGNLLIWRYDDEGIGAMEVLRTDGTTETVAWSYASAIADNGRFYFGGSSVAENGTEHQWILSSDPEYHDKYTPIEVADGYLYYIDATKNDMAPVYDGSRYPKGNIELNRLNLETGDIELLSGPGTNYLGIDDGMLYYTRESFTMYDYYSGEGFDVKVDDGLYSMNLEVCAETRIADLTVSNLVLEDYVFVQDGIVYAEYSDYSGERTECRIDRRMANGEALPPLELKDELILICVNDGVL